MDLREYVENIQRQLLVAADAGGEDARALAERLSAPLDAAIRLTIQDALSVAADEITCELAPGSVELRLRGGDLEFVVTPPAPIGSAAGERPEGSDAGSAQSWRGASIGPSAAGDGDDAAVSRINLRMPDHLKSRVEMAAASEGLSVNAWLVRAAAAAVDRRDAGRRPESHSPQGAQRYAGWVR